MNENIASYAVEIDGNLNEQNFLDNFVNTLISNDLVQNDIALRIYGDDAVCDPQDFTASGAVLQITTEWIGMADTEVTFNCPAGKLYIIWSFQLTSEAGLLPPGSGLNFAIELDGAVQYDSIAGAGDPSNEFTSCIDVASSSVLDFDSSPSFRNIYQALRIEGCYTVSAGSHTVRLAYRNLANYLTSFDQQWLTNREQITFWMWA